MKHVILTFFIFLFVFDTQAQTSEARLITEMPIMPCGQVTAYLDGIYGEWQNSPDSEIYVVYYGGRFRKITLLDRKTQSRKIQLKYPHREDALNLAKAIPLYLTTRNGVPTETRNLLKDKIILLDGGFQEDFGMEIWLVPKGSAPPAPTPTIDEKYIKFRTGKPRGIPDYKSCYDGY